MPDPDLLETDRLSDYARRQFEAAGLADIAIRVSQGELLEREDTPRLANAPLSLLAKLVSLRPDHEPCGSAAVDPVVYLPREQWPTSCGLNDAVGKVIDVIRVAARELASLIEQDERVRDFGECVHTLHVVVDAPQGRHEGESLLHHVIQTVSERLAQETEQAGISVFLTHSRSDLLPMFNESQASSSMRAIAIACLTSARDAQIRAPSGRLGVKTAHVALSFGANHLGQVAVDAATAAALNIPTLAELADALRYDTPTPV